MSKITRAEIESSYVIWMDTLNKLVQYELKLQDTSVITSYIERLVARIEELKRENAGILPQHVANLIAKDAVIADCNQQINRLDGNLTALIEAAEAILLEVNFETIEPELVAMGDLRNLSKAVKEAKGNG